MAGRPEYLNIAQILTTFGVRGELKVRSLSDDPQRLRGLSEVSCLLATGERRTLHPKKVTVRPNGAVIALFEEFDNPESAAVLRGAFLQVKYAEARRTPGKVLFADVIDLAAVDDATGARLGTVTDVYSATQDILEIKTPDGREVLVPWVEQFVKPIDPATGEVRLTPIPGMFDE